MKKKERIAELERKVAELEARPYPFVYPAVSVPTSWISYGRCSTCGGALTQGHMCYGTYTISGGSIGGHAKASDISNIYHIGAAS